MTQSPGGLAPSHDTQNSQSTTDVARNEAVEVARTAAQSASEVAETVGDQARRVTAETTRQARNLVEEGKGQLAEQARDGQRKAAEGLHTLADQLQEMSRTSDGGGIAPELAQRAAERTRTVASWLEQHEPGDLLTEARTFARRKPGMFLAGAALAGIFAGRLTRSMVTSQSASKSDNAAEGMPERGRPTAAAPRNPVPAALPLPAHVDEPPAPPVDPVVPAPPPDATTPPGPVTR